jgi:hypothetical protein
LSTAFSAAQQRHAAAGHDAFFQRACVADLASSSSALRSFISVSVARTDVDLSHAAGQLRQPLLQLLAVVIAVGRFDLAADLLDAAFDAAFLPAPPTMVVSSEVMRPSWPGPGRSA